MFKNDAGYVVPFEDIKGMAEKVVFLCAMRKNECNEGATARQRVRTHHDVAIAGEEIFRVIDQVCAVQKRANIKPRTHDFIGRRSVGA